MKEILAPLVSANEDLANIVEVKVKNNNFYKKGQFICTLETSKTSVDVELEEDGYVYFLMKKNEEIKSGEILAIQSQEKINEQDINKYISKEKSMKKQNDLTVTKKAQSLINSHKINLKDIKKDGLVKETDVIEFIKKNNKDDGQNLKQKNYIELDKIMKISKVDKPDFEDIKRLKRTLLNAQQIYKNQWNRTVPSLEAIFNRWETGKAYSNNDEKTNISHLSYIVGNVKLGKNVYVGPFTFLDGGGNLIIGDNTSIAAGVQIYSHDNISRALSGHLSSTIYGQTSIGKSCFIGPNTIITRGVKVGDHCFIGAGSVVTFDVPSFTAVAGSPADIIGKVKINKDGTVKISRERSY